MTVFRSLSINCGFIGNEENFEADSLFNGKPMHA